MGTLKDVTNILYYVMNILSLNPPFSARSLVRSYLSFAVMENSSNLKDPYTQIHLRTILLQLHFSGKTFARTRYRH